MEWDSISTKAYVEPRLLMAWAAAGMFASLQKKILKRDANIYILCGPGNNGGDGYALAWLFYSKGWADKINIFRYKNPKTEDSIYFSDLLAKNGISIREHSMFLQTKPKKEDVIIDALFGVGQSRKPENEVQSLIKTANISKALRVSVDVPTGIWDQSQNPDAFRADITYTFGAYRTMHLTDPGIAFCGKVVPLAIGTLPITSPKSRTANFQTMPKLRHSGSHKYLSGSIWIIGGDYSMEGAALLAAKTFLRCGGGIAQIFSENGRIHKSMKHLPEARFLQLADFDEQIKNAPFSADKPGVIVYGPGHVPDQSDRLARLWSQPPAHLIVDGGGLRELAQLKRQGKLPIRNTAKQNFLRILTPHAGEAADLGIERKNSLEAARTLAIIYNAIVYYKGPGGILASPDDKTIFFGSKEYELAVGGTGDVFCGILAAGLCRTGNELTNLEISIATYLMAANKISKRLGTKDALIPSVLIDELVKGQQ